MQDLIEKARTAIERRDWPVANVALYRLLSRERDLDGRAGDDPLDLALSILQGGDFQQGWELVKLFPKIGRRAIAPLIALLEAEETDRETRWLIVRILREFDDPACTLAFGELARRSGDEELATMAAEALASLGRPAIEGLFPLLDDPATRPLAVAALSRVRRPEAIEPLLGVVNDESARVRAMAIEALSSFHDRRIVAAIRSALGDPDPEPRWQAAIASGYLALQYPGPDWVLALAPLLADRDREVYRATALALGRIGTREAARVLFSGLRSPSTPEDLKPTLVKALGWIESAGTLDDLAAGLHEEDESICREIIAVLSRWEFPETRRRAARVLEGFYGARPSISGKTAIKQALALAFGELGDSGSRSILLALAGDREAIVRLHAVSALKKLDRPVSGRTG
ncbi:HEAT repeat domain-containing protein [Pannus brasiliensis CCIBt3594]|uniref:HEAT repeat domain-containing protein n=1 Tax=Pannus brasiliensis CCIBt3594 TaxID=1427578 RepID=A0AAW9QTX0_9CHRO